MHRTRITRINGALSIEIPVEVLESLGLHAGDEVDIGTTKGAVVVLPIRLDDQRLGNIDPEFAARVDAFIDKYRDALISLADR